MTSTKRTPAPRAQVKPLTTTQRRFRRLIEGSVLGVVHHNGAVESRFVPMGDDLPNHSQYWPGVHHCRWRWSHSESIYFLYADRISYEEYASIQSHLTKRHGLQWWDNGHHDIEQLMRAAGFKVEDES